MTVDSYVHRCELIGVLEKQFLFEKKWKGNFGNKKRRLSLICGNLFQNFIRNMYQFRHVPYWKSVYKFTVYVIDLALYATCEWKTTLEK